MIDTSSTWIRSRVSGRFDETICREIITTVDSWRGNRVGLTVFSDVSAVDDYDVGARELVSSWLRRLGNAFDQVHILVSGRTIAWAVKIVAVVSGANIVPYHAPEAFERAFRSHIEAKR